MLQLTLFEDVHWESGLELIAGVDEAGRGPLAGPVVAAACIIPRGVQIEGINDSKQLTAEQRDEVFLLLTTHPQVIFSIGVVEAPVIDKINILQATFQAMRIAVDGLAQKPEMVLVDGHLLPVWPYRSQAIIGGDGLSQSIGAASIIAKVTRDKRMKQEDANYPGYGFASHKGYATKEHLEAIVRLGPCPIHRLSFDPFKSSTQDQLSLLL